MVITVRISAFKHGTSLWDPACPKLGTDLHTDPSVSPDPSLQELRTALRQHGLGDHPVIATL